METQADEEGIRSQARKMLNLSFTLQNGTLITPLLLFCSQQRLVFVFTKINRSVENTTNTCFNSCVHSPMEARRKTDENPNSSVVADTMKPLARRSYGYQNMNREGHYVTKCVGDEKTHGVINSKFFRKLGHKSTAFLKLYSSKNRWNKKTFIFGSFVLQ